MIKRTLDHDRCRELIFNYQCERKAVIDGYCKQHHPDAKAAREKKSKELYQQRKKESDWYKLGLMKAENNAFKLKSARLVASSIKAIESFIVDDADGLTESMFALRETLKEWEE